MQSAGSCAWFTTKTHAAQQTWGGAAGKLPSRKGTGAAGQQPAECPVILACIKRDVTIRTREVIFPL